MGAAAGIVQAVTAVAGMSHSRKARKERRAARKEEAKRRRLEERRAAIEAVRQATIQRAEVAAMGEAAGIGGSSALVGATGSIQSQGGANLGFAQQQSALRDSAARKLEKAAYWDWRQGIAQSISSSAGSMNSGGKGG